MLRNQSRERIFVVIIVVVVIVVVVDGTREEMGASNTGRARSIVRDGLGVMVITVY